MRYTYRGRDDRRGAHRNAADVLQASLLTQVYGLPMAVVDHPLKPGKIVLTNEPNTIR